MELGSEAARLLDSYFHDAPDLSRIASVQLELESDCRNLSGRLRDARYEAKRAAGEGSAQLEAVALSLDDLCRLCEDYSAPWRASGSDLVRELSDLAAQVSRVAEVRAYVEAVLQMERLVGDLEDAVFAAASSTSAVHQRGNSSQAAARLSSAMDSLSSIEELMADVTKSRPQWQRLISAADLRVDRAAAALRPIAVSDYRAAVISIGWPPPLSVTSDSSQPNNKSNPLLDMQGEKKVRFQESFISVSRFQAVQVQRRNREVGQAYSGRHQSSKRPRREALLSIEELVIPITAKFETHFTKWLHKPEFAFALAYNVAKQHAAVVDGILQPLLDQEFLGYNAREEWVSDFVTMVSEHLRRSAIPALLAELEDDSLAEQASTIWLHTVDQTLAFDAKMQALVVRGTGMANTGGGGEEGFHSVAGSVFGLREPCISVFADRGDWLQVWTGLELKDMTLKLQQEFRNEVVWKVDAASLSEFKAPTAALKLTAAVWNAIERCKTLPEAVQRLSFVRGTAIPILDNFLQELLQRCQEAEALTALADEASMTSVAACLNAARYCEHTLKNWCEDLFFLELKLAEDEESSAEVSEVEGSVFDMQLGNLARFRSSWIGKLVSVMSRGFEARAREYFRNKKRWCEELTVESELPSASLVEALALLQNQVTGLKSGLDRSNFVEVWQRLIPSLDQLMFQGVVFSGAKFSEKGVEQFSVDVQSLYLVFKPYCARPASLFSALNDTLKLLKMKQQEASDLLWKLSEDEDDEDACFEALKQSGIRKMSGSLAHRILCLRMLN